MSLSGPGSIRHPRQPSNRSWREKNTCVAKSFLQAPLKPSPLRDCGAPFRGSILEGRLKGCAWPHRIQLNGFKLLSHESLHHHQLLAEMLKHDLRMKAANVHLFNARTPGHYPFQRADSFLTYVFFLFGRWNKPLVESVACQVTTKAQKGFNISSEDFRWVPFGALLVQLIAERYVH